ALQESWMTFVKGIPELEVPVLDPMVVELIENDYNAGEVLGKFVLRDVKTYGMAKTNFLAVRPYRSGNTMNMQIDIEIPKVFVDGNYKAEGTVGPFKIGGKGYFNISMEAISATWSLEGHIENDRWVIEHFHVDPELEKMHVYFDDLFNGNKELNSAAMSFVNEYWLVLYKGMLPTVEKQWDFHLTEYVNKMIFSKISASKAFP
ncbi:JHBP domain-containing protein, partial [Salmonella enterica subsp. enterica serovar Paratyphi A]